MGMPEEADLRPAKGKNDAEYRSLQQRGLRVSEDEEGDEKNGEIHDHIPSLRRKDEPGVVEVAFRSRYAEFPLCLKGDAADHAQDDEDEVPGAQDGDESMGEALI